MPKYKVLLPTNGYEVGQEIELTEEQATNYNAGEAKPRVQLISEEAPVEGEAKAEETNA